MSFDGNPLTSAHGASDAATPRVFVYGEPALDLARLRLLPRSGATGRLGTGEIVGPLDPEKVLAEKESELRAQFSDALDAYGISTSDRKIIMSVYDVAERAHHGSYRNSSPDMIYLSHCVDAAMNQMAAGERDGKKIAATIGHDIHEESDELLGERGAETLRNSRLKERTREYSRLRDNLARHYMKTTLGWPADLALALTGLAKDKVGPTPSSRSKKASGGMEDGSRHYHEFYAEKLLAAGPLALEAKINDIRDNSRTYHLVFNKRDCLRQIAEVENFFLGRVLGLTKEDRHVSRLDEALSRTADSLGLSPAGVESLRELVAAIPRLKQVAKMTL